MNEDEQVIWRQPVSFQDFVQRFQATPNQRRVELVPKTDPQKFYGREKVAPPSQDQGEIRDANKERVNRSLSNYASNNFLLSTSNIRPDQNGRYNPGLGQFAGDQTALTLSMGFDPFNTSNYYKVATQIPKFRNWGLTRLLANELNNEVRVAGELGKNLTKTVINPKNSYNISDNITLYRANPTRIKNPTYKGEAYGDNTGQYVGKWFTDDPTKPNWYAANYARRGENPQYFQTSMPRYWAEKQRASNIISNPKIEYEPEDFILSNGVDGLPGQPYSGRVGTLQYLNQKFKPIRTTEPRTSLKFFEHRTDLAKTLTDSQWDSGYLPAAEAGDLITSKALRDTHFVTKSGNNFLVSRGKPVQLYHGVKSGYNPAFIEFNPNIEGTHSAIYLSNNEPMSRSYIGPFKYKDNNFLKKLYAKVEHPFIIDAKGRIWSDIPYGENVLSTRILEQRLKHQNILGNIGEGGTKADGIIVKDVQDWGGPYGRYKAAQEGKLTGDVIAIDNPSFIKSSEAITYDNNGKIIPLSQRDNFINSDIRYHQGGKIIEKFKNRNK